MRRFVMLVLLAGCGRLDFDEAGPSEGLVAYYPLDDITANGTDDTLGGPRALCNPSCPVVTVGHVNGALRFDGATQGLVVSAPTLTSRSPFTAALWLDWSGTLLGYQCAATKTVGAGAQNTWTICMQPDNTVFFGTSVNGSVEMLDSNRVVATNQWHHVAVSWDGSTKAIWIDGSLDTTAPASSNDFDSQPMSIGADQDSGSVADGFPGMVDEVRIYNRVLDASEIAALAR